MSLEDLPLGWSGLYPVLRAMEESGKIRRGHFVDGYSGAQFAYAAAVDRLRSVRGDPQEHRAFALAATDPANPYGALLPWPDPTHERARPRRASGARVVIVDGEPILFADRHTRRLWTFPTREPSRLTETLAHAARALGQPGPRFPRGGLRIESIDGENASEAPAAEAFVRAGYRRSYKGIELDRPAQPETGRRPAD